MENSAQPKSKNTWFKPLLAVLSVFVIILSIGYTFFTQNLSQFLGDLLPAEQPQFVDIRVNQPPNQVVNLDLPNQNSTLENRSSQVQDVAFIIEARPVKNVGQNRDNAVVTFAELRARIIDKDGQTVERPIRLASISANCNAATICQLAGDLSLNPGDKVEAITSEFFGQASHSFDPPPVTQTREVCTPGECRPLGRVAGVFSAGNSVTQTARKSQFAGPVDILLNGQSIGGGFLNLIDTIDNQNTTCTSSRPCSGASRNAGINLDIPFTFDTSFLAPGPQTISATTRDFFNSTTFSGGPRFTMNSINQIANGGGADFAATKFAQGTFTLPGENGVVCNPQPDVCRTETIVISDEPPVQGIDTEVFDITMRTIQKDIVPAQADLSSTIVLNPQQGKVGDIVTFTVELTNNGDLEARDVEYLLPFILEGENFVINSNGGGQLKYIPGTINVVGSNIERDTIARTIIESIAIGQTVTITLDVEVTKPSTIRNENINIETQIKFFRRAEGLSFMPFIQTAFAQEGEELLNLPVNFIFVEEEIAVCEDGIDNDNDGLIDAQDPACIANPDSIDERDASLLCDDGIDNDNDGFIDTLDPGCNGADDPDNSEGNANIQCDDGVDNDNDGFVDGEDPACQDEQGNPNLEDNDEGDDIVIQPINECEDGIDNDNDGNIDFPADSGCENAEDNDESDDVVIQPVNQCEDGIDNDNDGNIDFPADSGCENAQDNDESDDVVIQPVTQCTDGIDNDNDGNIDRDDLGCDSDEDDNEGDEIVIVPEPGIFDNIGTWLRGDDIDADNNFTNNPENETRVETWNDFSGNNINADRLSGNPNIVTEGVNFNDAVNFRSSTMDFVQNTIATGQNSYAFIVAARPAVNHFGVMLSGGINRNSRFLKFSVQSNSSIQSNWRNNIAQTPAGAFIAGVPSIFVETYDNQRGRDLYANGVLRQQNTSTAKNAGTAALRFIGRALSSAVQLFNGDIMEIIAYERDVSPEDLHKISSYLAVKYGITLDNEDIQENVVEGSYNISGNAAFWNGEPGGFNIRYHNDVAGIGRSDEPFQLNQPKSRSQNLDSRVIMKNPENLDNGEYIMWGNNNGDFTFSENDAPQNFQRVGRRWTARETGELGNVEVAFDANNLEIPEDAPNDTIFIVVDTNNNKDFTDDEPIEMNDGGVLGDDQAGDEIWTTTINFSTDEVGQFFSFALKFQTECNDGIDNDNDGDIDADDIACLDENGEFDPTIDDEAGDDSDNDGVPDDQDLDADNDGIPNAEEGEGDTDGDGIPDFLDLDSDNDTVLDIVEGGGVDADNDGKVDNFTDENQDGIDDTIAANPLPLPDTDEDGQRDFQDPDDDNDNVNTIDEDPNEDGNPLNDDTDNDGIPNFLDPDDDNDNVNTIDEDPNENDNPLDDDTDNDGIPDFLDPDDDNDGTPTADEDPNENDNPLDDDTDNDGIPDFLDPDDPNGDDRDNDGVPDDQDLDADNDGIPNAEEGEGDTDGDGIPDFLDLDSDNDTVSDIIEADGIDGDLDGKVDNFTDENQDGIDDTIAANPLPLPDTDEDGQRDFQDPDDDNDNVNTIDEDPNEDGNPLNDDTDLDGTPNFLDPDDDNDNVNTIDEDPNENDNPLDDDTDNDGIPDFLDPDDDNDGTPTADEDPNENDNPLDDDTDNDGIPDFLDPDDPGQTQCTDGLDNDDDGAIDENDPDCFDENGEFDPNDDSEGSACSDGIDNDGDGLIDFPEDPQCVSEDDVSEGLTQCNDGIDNDENGFIDLEDFNCIDDNDNLESTPIAVTKISDIFNFEFGDNGEILFTITVENITEDEEITFRVLDILSGVFGTISEFLIEISPSDSNDENPLDATV